MSHNLRVMMAAEPHHTDSDSRCEQPANNPVELDILSMDGFAA